MSPICASESIPKEPAYLILAVPFSVCGLIVVADLCELHISCLAGGLYFENNPSISRISNLVILDYPGSFTRTFYM